MTTSQTRWFNLYKKRWRRKKMRVMLAARKVKDKEARIRIRVRL